MVVVLLVMVAVEVLLAVVSEVVSSARTEIVLAVLVQVRRGSIHDREVTFRWFVVEVVVGLMVLVIMVVGMLPSVTITMEVDDSKRNSPFPWLHSCVHCGLYEMCLRVCGGNGGGRRDLGVTRQFANPLDRSAAVRAGAEQDSTHQTYRRVALYVQRCMSRLPDP